nr:helix-turn-helix domain-containing protein [Robbsia betulipollinis]
MLSLAGYRLDKRLGVVVAGDDTVQLTPREFAIAWMLFSRQGQYLSRAQIATAVWGCSEEVAGRTLEQHIYKLRKKLSLNGLHGARLSTQYAHGYRIEVFQSETFSTPVGEPVRDKAAPPVAV